MSSREQETSFRNGREQRLLNLLSDTISIAKKALQNYYSFFTLGRTTIRGGQKLPCSFPEGKLPTVVEGKGAH